jgi:hypothetical protein
MTIQKSLRFDVSAIAGETSRERQFRQQQVNGSLQSKTPGLKLLADLLKRQGRRIMSDITECPPDTLPAHLARLDDWREIVEHHLRHDLECTPEGRLSGAQLVNPSTLKDWLAAADITRKWHRAPAFLNHRDESLEKIFRGIDQLAGLIARDPELVEFLATRTAREVVS